MRFLPALMLATLVVLGLLLFMAGLVQQDSRISLPQQDAAFWDIAMTNTDESIERKIRHRPEPPKPEPKPTVQPMAKLKPQAVTASSRISLDVPSLDLSTDVAAVSIPAPGVMAEPQIQHAQPGQIQNAMPLPLLRIQPSYPAKALRHNKEGYVVLSFTISESGKVDDIEVVEAKPNNWFEKEAVRALRKWKFKPMVADGQPVAQPGQRIKLDFVIGS